MLEYSKLCHDLNPLHSLETLDLKIDWFMGCSSLSSSLGSSLLISKVHFNCRSTLERRSSAKCKQLNLRENKKRFIVKFSAKCSEKGELHVLAGEGMAILPTLTREHWQSME
ncbi:hypothetical protein HHK36_022341 [Tetracentron sinense]|uniref:Uncharacterized protein n=1 Tax=Tetracentron sinense TaxID=13715 RepID=A0A834YUR5_TETSI|nr:hypothetical protein HHK36_022341 [Tetracentron sinense]